MVNSTSPSPFNLYTSNSNVLPSFSGTKINFSLPRHEITVYVALYWAPKVFLPIHMGFFHLGKT
jgi:hypothetical protein